MQRREFLKRSTAAGVVLGLGHRTSWAKSADARVEVLLDEPIGQISPNVYGHFTEHIGGVIYDGVWVGKDSKIPNRDGIRLALVEHLKEIKAPIIRWPGGCFADSYDWRDGIGPAKDRPIRTNFWETDPDAVRLHQKGPQIFEPNAFGTNEFIKFCGLSGAEPYIAANVRSLTALDFDRWVEYCNSPSGSTTLAQERGARGFANPFNVRYWGIGNESWGCGGSFTPEDYATEFRRFTSWIPQYGLDLKLIGSGPSDDDIDWTHRFFEKLLSIRPDHVREFAGWSVHHYSWNLGRGKTEDWIAAKGDALRFEPVDWYELLRQSIFIEEILRDQWAAMEQYDPEHAVKLAVDEYGSWYREGTEVDPTHIFGQQITMRDALGTALTLDIFNRNADKMLLATCAQLVNNLNALFLAHEDRFIVTPNYYVFALYAAHQGAQAVRTEFASPMVHYNRDGTTASFPGLLGSASRKQNAVTVTMVNPDLENGKIAQIAVPGAQIGGASARVLAARDVHDHNTFDQPDAVTLRTLEVFASADLIHVEIPASSVASVRIELK